MENSKAHILWLRVLNQHNTHTQVMYIEIEAAFN